MKKIWLLAILLGLAPGPGLAQTMDELLNDGKNTDNVLTQSMGLNRHNYSPLNKINKGNVKRLVPVWSTSLQNDMGELAAPVVYNGVMYVINGKWTVAIDVETRDYVLGPSHKEAARALRAKHVPNGRILTMTIGPPTDSDIWIASRILGAIKS